MISRRLFAALPAKAGLLRVVAGPADGTTTSKVVYHLDEAVKVNAVLGNIRNHYAGMPDGNIEIVLVVLGAALRSFRKASADLETAEALAELRELGLQARACVNTLHADNLAVSDLLPGFTVAARGGVVELASLQHAGFAYIRP